MASRSTCVISLPGAPLRAHSGFKMRIVALSIGLLLAGCAAQSAFRDGKELVAQDKVEMGLTKFQQAMAADPGNYIYKAAYVQTRDRAVNAYIHQADRLAAEDKPVEAQALYQKALALDANSERARAGMAALEAGKRHAQLLQEAQAALGKQDIDQAQAKLAAILEENLKHPAAAALKRNLAQQSVKPLPDAALSAAYKKPISIEFRDAQLKQVFEVIALSSGLNFVFDKDVKTDQKTSIFLKNSTAESVIYMLLMTNQLEQQVLDNNTILIYPNTEAKQKEYQELVVKSFFLANADAKNVANTIKTIVKSRDIVVDEKLNMIIVRDSPEAIKLTEKLVALHDSAEPEVMLEVEILEVKRSRLMNLGIEWPNSLSLSPLPSPLTLRGLSDLNSSTIGVGVGAVTIRAQKNDLDANLLANPRIRTRNREKARIVIGEKVPIISTTTGFNAATPISSETITYLDVGLKLEVEPTIHLDNDVAIKVALEVSNLGAEVLTRSGSVAYRIGTRNATTVLRLKDGENQVLAGLINDEDRRSASKVPGLGEVPVLGRLFGNSFDNNDKTEILLSITPHIIRNIERPSRVMAEFRSGTQTSFRSAPDGAGRMTAVLPANTAATPMRAAIPPAAPAAVELANKVMAAEWMGSTQFKVGDTVEVQLVMESKQPLANVAATFGFDNRALQLIGVAESDFLKQGGAQTTFASEVDPSGKISVKGARIGDSAATGATGPGFLATLKFRAVAPSDAAQVQLLKFAPTDIAGQPVAMSMPAPHVLRIQK